MLRHQRLVVIEATKNPQNLNQWENSLIKMISTHKSPKFELSPEQTTALEKIENKLSRALV